MTIAEICILLACLLPIACAGMAKSRGFDNHHPRQWAQGLQGWHARANAAQLNSFEALPLFIAGVLVAQQHQAAQSTVNMVAVAFIVLRVAYVAMYLMDRANLRSLCWGLAMACSVALFFV